LLAVRSRAYYEVDARLEKEKNQIGDQILDLIVEPALADGLLCKDSLSLFSGLCCSTCWRCSLEDRNGSRFLDVNCSSFVSPPAVCCCQAASRLMATCSAADLMWACSCTKTSLQSLERNDPNLTVNMKSSKQHCHMHRLIYLQQTLWSWTRGIIPCPPRSMRFMHHLR
jgi:hypothetical protein